ncbi:recombination-associated protein RdgC [Azonexus sp.]|jgi:recombination associated protein RdgC|uniref:recombination-associated protein RdgC n=1 Tax=Azonexus sp. TaxID=1872668 RepID=UPI00282D8D21|nr:recombination-associated protein RdgC [Azonexus sp.]MDR1995126.1 recombination-associated protein RdgC [Azonexus sp.]
MWFRNLQIYRLPSPWAISKAALTAQLKRGLFERCPGNQMSSRGFVAPREHGDLVHVVAGHWLLCLAVEQRLLPADTVNRTVRELSDQAAKQHGHHPGRRGLRELRERVVSELLPKAFTRVRRTFIWIDPVGGWLGIDTGTPAGAEPVIDHLRHCLDTFPIAPLRTRISPVSRMAGWLDTGDASAEGFSIDSDCELKAVDENKAVVRYVRQPLTDEEIAAEIKAHLAAGQLPTRLALTWNDRISFVLTEKLEIRRLYFLDLIKEAADQRAENADDQFNADFALMTGEFVRFLPALVLAMGGEEE